MQQQKTNPKNQPAKETNKNQSMISRDIRWTWLNKLQQN